MQDANARSRSEPVNNEQRTRSFGMVGRFFFSPTDPSTLGFMRIMTGLILLYVHAAYSLDLQAFLGPHAWWDQQTGNTQRREAPFHPTPFGWTEFRPTVWVDDVPHRRGAEIEFFRDLPSDPTERAMKLRYLKRIYSLTTPEAFQGISLSNSASKIITSEQDQKVRAALGAEKVPEAGTPVFIPDFIRNLPPKERLIVWDELLAFNASLPSDSEKQEYVLVWLSNYIQRVGQKEEDYRAE